MCVYFHLTARARCENRLVMRDPFLHEPVCWLASFVEISPSSKVSEGCDRVCVCSVDGKAFATSSLKSCKCLNERKTQNLRFWRFTMTLFLPHVCFSLEPKEFYWVRICCCLLRICTNPYLPPQLWNIGEAPFLTANCQSSPSHEILDKLRCTRKSFCGWCWKCVFQRFLKHSQRHWN